MSGVFLSSMVMLAVVFVIGARAKSLYDRARKGLWHRQAVIEGVSQLTLPYLISCDACPI